MVEGRYFPPGSPNCVTARARISGGMLIVENEAGAVLAEAPVKSVTVSHRLGNVARRFRLPGGALFETHDNDAVDELLGARTALLHRLEHSLQWVFVAFLVAGAALYLFVQYGIPATAAWLARETPDSVLAAVSGQTLDTLDRLALQPTQLGAAQRERAEKLFATMAALGRKGPHGYRLIFRDAPTLGPNAFALPDGTIVMTDQLWPYVTDGDGLEGVFGHEIAHVDRRHGMQRVYQAAIVPAALAMVTGDVSQVTHLGAILPGVLIQSSYSRGFEQQADDDAAADLNRIGKDPGALARLLQRLNAKFCGGKDCGPSWLGSHPLTRDRVARLLRERTHK